MTALAGSDYIAANGTLVIPAGASHGTIAVTIKGDTVREANETFRVTLSTPIAATIASGTGTGTIVNDD